MGANDIRFGHSIRGEEAALRQVLELVAGDAVLTARRPLDTAAVDATEQLLGIDPANRPIYAYLGDLNPALGTLGLVLERTWSRNAVGLTRCDSGGLGGRRGAFAEVAAADVHTALAGLSYSGAALSAWEQDFAQEIDRGYADGSSGYVTGAEPDPTQLADVRRTCIERCAAPRDRRLWTWEARLASAPLQSEYVALVVTAEMAKRLDELVRDGAEVPESIRVLRGSQDSQGDHFQLRRVRSTLLGG